MSDLMANYGQIIHFCDGVEEGSGSFSTSFTSFESFCHFKEGNCFLFLAAWH